MSLVPLSGELFPNVCQVGAVLVLVSPRQYPSLLSLACLFAFFNTQLFLNLAQYFPSDYLRYGHPCTIPSSRQIPDMLAPLQPGRQHPPLSTQRQFVNPKVRLPHQDVLINTLSLHLFFLTHKM